MRLIQLLVRDEHQDKIFDTLDEIGVDSVALSTDRRNASFVSFPVPPGAVEEILDQLRDAGFETEEYTIISDLDSAITPNFDALEKRYTEGPHAESRISHEELRTSARELQPDRTTFSAQAVLSATVAAAGLLLNSAIAIVGSMVLSPFTSSLLSAALGAVIDDHDLLTDSVKSQSVGLFIAVLTGIGVGLLAKLSSLVSPNHTITSIKLINDFSSPNLLLLTIAIAAGSASAFALATNQGVALAGVAVAAAIVPSAATVGIGLAWKQLSVALGALILLVINVIFINIIACITFLLLGYQPSLLKDIR